MKHSRFLVLAALFAIGALAVSPFVPKPVWADTVLLPTYSNTCGNPPAYNCNPGVLHVYVVVNTDSQFAPAQQPGNFSVTVNAQNSAPISFPGSQSGTNLSVLGLYSVTAQALAGYTPTYSVGCNGSLTGTQEATCVITENAYSAYLNAPVPYPYPYIAPILQCAPAIQTVGLGQSATFNVQGTASGPFTWSAADRTYQAIGPTFSTSFTSTGTKLVTVTNSTQSATCAVNVVSSPVAVAPTYPSSPLPQVPNVTVAPVPSLPNTGFGPLTTLQIASMLALLIGVGVFLTPYVRKTLTAIG